MKILILTFWCLIPLGLLAFHYGPGRTGLALDETSKILAVAENHTASENWKDAVASYELALSKLPKERVADARAIRLAIAKARMQASELPIAREELAALSAELEADPTAEPALRDGALAELATARFYMTYLMKLEGLPETEWEPEIEAARQDRKLLVQRATDTGDSKAASLHADDLEAAIRLARTDPADLYGKPIPKPCSGCKSGKCSNPRPSPNPGKKPEDARGASSGPPVDGGGS